MFSLTTAQSNGESFEPVLAANPESGNPHADQDEHRADDEDGDARGATVPEEQSEPERDQRENREEVALLESSSAVRGVQAGGDDQSQRVEAREHGEGHLLGTTCRGEAHECARDENDASGNCEQEEIGRGPVHHSQADAKVGDDRVVAEDS